jgi:glycosyltransferase involved in cell wall biosynthesis
MGSNILSLQQWLDLNETWKAATTPITAFDPGWHQRDIASQLFRLISVIDAHDFDLVVFHRSMTELGALAGLAKKMGLLHARLFIEDFFLDVSLSGVQPRVIRWLRRHLRGLLYRVLVKGVDGLGVHTTWERDNLPGYFNVQQGKFKFLPFWLDDPSPHRPTAERPAFLPGHDYVLVAGTLRDYDCFLRALDGLPYSGIVFAQPWDMPSIHRTVGTDRVAIMRFTDHRTYLAYLYASRVVVIPLHRERHPRSLGQTQLLEAMIARKPVVVADTFHVRDYTDEESVLYYRSEDSSDLRDKIGLAWTDECLRRRLVSRGYALALQFRFDFYLTKLLTLICNF